LLYPHLSAQDNLRFYGRLYDVPDLPARMEQVLTQVGLVERRADRVQTLSRGMTQRLAIARAILHRPRVMLLDEPYTGLDQRATATLSAILQAIATADCAVLLTTHNLARGLADGQRIVILHRGQVVHQAHRSAIDAASFATQYQALTGP
jgi:heme exporter protein A